MLQDASWGLMPLEPPGVLAAFACNNTIPMQLCNNLRIFTCAHFLHGPWSILTLIKGELNPKIKFILFERTLKITE